MSVLPAPKLSDTHAETYSLSSGVTQASHTLSPWVFSPQGGPTVDQRDSPTDVGFRGQFSDPWVLVEPLHSLLKADRRGDSGHNAWHVLLGRNPVTDAQPVS